MADDLAGILDQFDIPMIGDDEDPLAALLAEAEKALVRKQERDKAARAKDLARRSGSATSAAPGGRSTSGRSARPTPGSSRSSSQNLGGNRSRQGSGSALRAPANDGLSAEARAAAEADGTPVVPAYTTVGRKVGRPSSPFRGGKRPPTPEQVLAAEAALAEAENGFLDTSDLDSLLAEADSVLGKEMTRTPSGKHVDDAAVAAAMARYGALSPPQESEAESRMRQLQEEMSRDSPFFKTTARPKLERPAFDLDELEALKAIGTPKAATPVPQQTSEDDEAAAAAAATQAAAEAEAMLLLGLEDDPAAASEGLENGAAAPFAEDFDPDSLEALLAEADRRVEEQMQPAAEEEEAALVEPEELPEPSGLEADDPDSLEALLAEADRRVEQGSAGEAASLADELELSGLVEPEPVLEQELEPEPVAAPVPKPSGLKAPSPVSVKNRSSSFASNGTRSSANRTRQSSFTSSTSSASSSASLGKNTPARGRTPSTSSGIKPPSPARVSSQRSLSSTASASSTKPPAHKPAPGRSSSFRSTGQPPPPRRTASGRIATSPVKDNRAPPPPRQGSLTSTTSAASKKSTTAPSSSSGVRMPSGPPKASLPVPVRPAAGKVSGIKPPRSGSRGNLPFSTTPVKPGSGSAPTTRKPSLPFATSPVKDATPPPAPPPVAEELPPTTDVEGFTPEELKSRVEQESEALVENGTVLASDALFVEQEQAAVSEQAEQAQQNEEHASLEAELGAAAEEPAFEDTPSDEDRRKTRLMAPVEGVDELEAPAAEYEPEEGDAASEDDRRKTRVMAPVESFDELEAPAAPEYEPEPEPEPESASPTSPTGFHVVPEYRASEEEARAAAEKVVDIADDTGSVVDAEDEDAQRDPDADYPPTVAMIVEPAVADKSPVVALMDEAAAVLDAHEAELNRNIATSPQSFRKQRRSQSKTQLFPSAKAALAKTSAAKPASPAASKPTPAAKTTPGKKPVPLAGRSPKPRVTGPIKASPAATRHVQATTPTRATLPPPRRTGSAPREPSPRRSATAVADKRSLWEKGTSTPSPGVKGGGLGRTPPPPSQRTPILNTHKRAPSPARPLSAEEQAVTSRLFPGTPSPGAPRRSSSRSSNSNAGLLPPSPKTPTTRKEYDSILNRQLQELDLLSTKSVKASEEAADLKAEVHRLRRQTVDMERIHAQEQEKLKARLEFVEHELNRVHAKQVVEQDELEATKVELGATKRALADRERALAEGPSDNTRFLANELNRSQGQIVQLRKEVEELKQTNGGLKRRLADLQRFATTSGERVLSPPASPAAAPRAAPAPQQSAAEVAELQAEVVALKRYAEDVGREAKRVAEEEMKILVAEMNANHRAEVEALTEQLAMATRTEPLVVDTVVVNGSSLDRLAALKQRMGSRSTSLSASPVPGGPAADPAADLDQLLAESQALLGDTGAAGIDEF